MKDKKPSTIEGIIRQNTDNSLPYIVILDEVEEVFHKCTLGMEEKTREMLINWGKETITDDEYAEIGFINGLKETIEKMETEDAEKGE